jgi:hypothetical protein
MNYPYLIPGQQVNTTSFVANATLKLGAYSKSPEANTLLTVDYSQLIPAMSLTRFSFKIQPGGSPQLWIDTVKISGDILTFMLSGGMGGRSYELAIISHATDGEARTDVLNVNVIGDDICCDTLQPLSPSGNGVVTSDGLVIINTAPRFFVSGVAPVGANVLDRWYNTATGEVYDYITDGLNVYWQLAGSSGDDGGGGGSGSAANILNIAPIHPDGVTTGFTLTAVGGAPVTISSSNTLFVSVDGVWQDSTTQYSAVNNRITFTQAPSTDSNVFMLWFAPPVQNPS